MAERKTFDRLYSMAELAAMSTRQRNIYERSLKNYWDMQADKETTRNRLKQERAEGRAEGVEAANIQNIKRMAAKGFTVEQIADILELQQEYVQSHID